MPTPRNGSHRWQRLLLIERIVELRLLAQERDSAFAADMARRAAMCLDDDRELALSDIEREPYERNH
jgi:hypothetical protein